MLEFATLLIGLVAGERMVELSVQPPVVSVEIVLDGEAIAKIDEAPWRARIDLGPALRPHRLVANGLDVKGNLVDSIQQLLNYNRPSFEVVILLDPPSTGQSRTGRLVWRGALDDPPMSVTLQFDGRPLELDTRARFVLPPHDSGEIHILETLVEFDRQHSAHAVLTFGSLYGDNLTSALTAIPFRSPADRPWEAARVREWIAIQGRAPDIFKTTGGPGSVVVLRGQEIERSIRGPRAQTYRRHPTAPGHRLQYEVGAISPLPLKGQPGTFRLTDLGTMSRQDGLRPILLRSRPLVPRRGADGRVLQKKGPKIWDALAVAGTQASASGQPRAVVLMLDSGKGDKSDLDSKGAIRYLQQIHVPVFLWSSHRVAVETIESLGAVRTYVGSADIDRLCIDVAEELASQTIVWLQGEYLPSDVEITPAAPPGFTFVE